MSIQNDKLLNLQGAKALYDDLRNRDSALNDDVVHLEDNLYTYKTTSGNPVIVEDAVADAVKTMRIEIAPVQDLHGYDFPWPAGGGKNLIDLSFINTASADTNISSILNGIKVSNNVQNMYRATNSPSSVALGLVNGKTYTFSAHAKVISGVARLAFRRSNDNGIIVQSSSLTSGEGDLYCTYTYDSTIPTYVSMFCTYADSTIGEVEYTSVQIEEGSSVTSYAPYSNICPISGWTEAKLTGTGKNLFSDAITAGKNIDASGVLQDQNDRSATVNGCVVKPETTYTLSYQGNLNCGIFFYKQDGSFDSFLAWAGAPRTFTTPANVTLVRFTFYAPTGITYPQLELGSSATAYEPFGTVSTIPFGQTVYGGELTINRDGTGQAVVDRAIIDLGALTWAGGTNGHFYASSAPEYKLSQNVKMMCSSYSFGGTRSASPWYGTNGTLTAYFNQNAGAVRELYICDERFTNTSDFTTAVVGQKLIYELATPVTIPLTAPQVQLLTGYNTVYADTGAILSMLYPVEKYQTAEQADRERIHIVDSTAEPVKTLTDGADGVPMGVQFAVEPVQDLHGQTSPWPAGGGKNLLETTLAKLKTVNTSGTWTNNNYTVNGITFTVNDDGTVNASGTATQDAQLLNYIDTSLYYGDLKFFGMIENDDSKYNVYVWDVDAGGRAKQWDGTTNSGNAKNNQYAQIKLVQNHATRIVCRVHPVGQISNVKFYPMLVGADVTDTSFAPYSNICPISGWTKAELTGTGKNLYMGAEQGQINTTTGENAASSTVYRTTYHIPVKTNKTYIISGLRLDTGKVRVFYYGADKQYLTNNAIDVVTKTITFTTSDNVHFIRFQADHALFDNTLNVMVEEGSTASPYEPFGTTYTIQFGETVYGGTLTVNKDGTGVLTVDRTTYTIPSTISLEFSATTKTYYFNISTSLPVSGTANVDINSAFDGICDSLKSCEANTAWATATEGLIGWVNSSKLRFRLPNIADDDTTSAKQCLVGMQVVYKIATPITIPLSAPIIRSILGVNNLYADTGDILSVDYSADTKLYVDNLFASLTNATGVSF